MLLLDGSEAMNSSVDYSPTRLLALRPCIGKLIAALLDSTPLSVVGCAVMRDTMAQVVAPLTNHAAEIVDALEIRYYLHGGSGSMSMDKGLRACLSELVELRKRAMRSFLRVVVVAASVTLVDGSDVLSLIPLLQRARIRVDVVHLLGAVHALQLVVSGTGGSYFCPTSYDHLQSILLREVVVPAHSTNRSQKRRRGDSDDTADGELMIPVGFPVLQPSLEKPGKHYMTCPQCALPQTSVPSMCPLCGLLICSAPCAEISFVWHHALIPPTEAATAAVMDEGSKCALCDVSLSKRPPFDGSQSSIVLMCSECRKPRCVDCDALVRTNFGICPSCL